MRYIAITLGVMLVFGLFVGVMFGKTDPYGAITAPFYLIDLCRPLAEGLANVFRFAIDPAYRDECVSNAWDQFTAFLGFGETETLDPSAGTGAAGGVGDYWESVQAAQTTE